MRAVGATFDRFFGERGTHLAAMVAYFALASFVPLIFLALSILGFLDQADSSSALVSYLEDVFPDQSVESIVNVVDAVQRNAATLSVVGAVALLWSALSLFSALESAFNIIYGRPNRPFLRGKVLATVYMSVALVFLFAGLAMVVLALLAFTTKSYRLLSQTYRGTESSVPAPESAAPVGPGHDTGRPAEFDPAAPDRP